MLDKAEGAFFPITIFNNMCWHVLACVDGVLFLINNRSEDQILK